MSSKLARMAGLFVALAATPALAQTTTAQDMREEIARLKAHISALETRLSDVEKAQAAPASAASPPPPSAAAPVPAAAARSADSVFNPAIGLVLDGRFAVFSKDPATYSLPGFARGDAADPGPRGFALGESELGLSANVDQWLHAAAYIAFERDGEVGVEEAYVQTTALPWGFTGKGGRFFGGFGTLNQQHKHAWDFADAPLPYLAFLNEQYAEDGAELRWLAPTDFFLEFGAAAGRGDAFPAGGASNRGVGAWNAFVHAGDDINPASSYRVGAGFLRTRAHDRETEDGANLFTGYSNTGVLDAVYKWAPGGNPERQNLKLQAEYFLRGERGAFNGTDYHGRQQGFYAQAMYQFMPRWRVGVRYDRLWAEEIDPAVLGGTVLDNLSHAPRRWSAKTDYSTSEFGRFRLQYNRDESRPDAIDHQWLLQYTVSFGAHPAHAY